MAVAAALSAVVSESGPAIILVTTAIAYVAARISARSAVAQTVGFNVVLATVVLGNIGIPHSHVVGAALAVLAGGLVQAALIPAFWAFRRFANSPPPAAQAQTGDDSLHALRMAVAVAIAMSLYRGLHVERGYWIALTTAIVLRPMFAATLSLVFARIGGTILGCVLAWGLTAVVPSTIPANAAIAVGFSALAFAFWRVGPASFSVAITGFVMFVLSLSGLSEGAAIVSRLEATALGAAVALGSYALIRTTETSNSQAPPNERA